MDIFFFFLLMYRCMVEIMDIFFYLFKYRCMVENYGFFFSFINVWLLRIMDFFFRLLMYRCMVESYGYFFFYRCIFILVWICRLVICLLSLSVFESVILVWLEVVGIVWESDKEVVITYCYTMYFLFLFIIFLYWGFFWIMRVNRL